MAERMEKAKIDQSDKVLTMQADDTRRGHYLGASLGATAMFGAAIMGFAGQPWLAAAFLAVPVMGLAKALVESVKSPTQQNVEAGPPRVANIPSSDAGRASAESKELRNGSPFVTRPRSSRPAVS